ncbi:MAG: hypothetical protein GX850_00785 [Clostridiaceae bacterium]|nr:hypothetical protein [Clostridiaceae bacterium]
MEKLQDGIPLTTDCHSIKRSGSADPVKVNGTISLEAVLVFPFIVMMMIMFIGAIRGEQDKMILSHSLDQTAHEIALLVPLADVVEKYADPQAWISQVITDKELAQIALDGLADVGATVLTSPLILQRLDLWATATSHLQNRQPPIGARRLAVDIDSRRQSIWLCLSYDRAVPFAEGWGEIKARVPLWNAHLFQQQEQDDEEEYDIWGMSNFERGAAIRKLFGGHLPQFYPVIAAWDGHEAVAIKSMDWTAPTWSSADAVERRLTKFINDLAAFEGAGGEGPPLGGIHAKRLVIVIPDNEIPWKTESLLNRWRRQALASGVVLDVRQYGTSYVYQLSD